MLLQTLQVVQLDLILANMVNEAAINAVKCGRKAISQDDLMEAVEVVIAGREKKDRILSKEEKRDCVIS